MTGLSVALPELSIAKASLIVRALREYKSSGPYEEMDRRALVRMLATYVLAVNAFDGGPTADDVAAYVEQVKS